MKVKKAIVLILFSSFMMFAIIFSASCASEEANWESLQYTRGESGFQCVTDENMNIDGYLDEDSWIGKNTFTHSEAGVTFSVTSFYTEKGMYFGMVSSDPTVVYALPYGAFKKLNTAFGLYIAGENDKNLDYRFAVQFDAKDTPRALGLFSYKSKATIQGNVNEGNTQGMTVEVFVSWSSINLDIEKDGLPQSIKVFINYLSVPYMNAEGVWLYPGLANESEFGKYYTFDKNGFLENDTENSVLGNSAEGYAMGANFDFSQSGKGIYGSQLSDDRSIPYYKKDIFVRAAKSENFMLSAKIVPAYKNGSISVGGDGSPAVYMIAQNDYGFTGFGLDLRSAYLLSDTVLLKQVKYINRSWTFGDLAATLYTGISKGMSQNGLTLTLIKEGTSYYYILGTPESGQMIAEISDLSLYSGEVCPGFLFSNIAVEISNIRYESFDIDSEGMDKLLDNLNIARVEVNSSSNGRISSDCTAVTKGGSANITFGASKTQYELKEFWVKMGSSDEINIIDDVRTNASNGTYLLDNITDDVSVRAVYGEANAAKLNFNITAATGSFSQVKIIIEGSNDKTKYYVITTGDSSMELKLPLGNEYNFTVISSGYKTFRTKIAINGDVSSSISLVPSIVGGTVLVNGVKMTSSSMWNYESSDSETVIRPKEVTTTNYAWINTTGKNSGKNFRVSLDYEVYETLDADPNGGIVISTGSDSNTYCILLLHNGVRITNKAGKTGWQDRSFSSFSGQVGGSLVDKTVQIIFERTDNIYKFKFKYGGETFYERTLNNITYNWHGNGSVLNLPSGDVAIGFCGTQNTGIVFSNVSYEENI